MLKLQDTWNTHNYIKYIQEEIKKCDDRKYYLHTFYEYKNYLEKEIKENPYDVEITCQLASIYMILQSEGDIDDSVYIDMLNDLLQKRKNELTNNDKARILTNLSFLHGDGCENKQAIDNLEAAIKLNPDFPNPYNALATLPHPTTETHITEHELKLFKKSYELSNELKYQYDYAVALFNTGSVNQAYNIFEKLIQNYPNDELVLYGYAVCCAEKGNVKKALEINNVLANNIKTNEDAKINEDDIANLYYLCNKYEEHSRMYLNPDSEGYCYYTSANWLIFYFYSLKTLDRNFELKTRFEDIITNKEMIITEEINEKISDDDDYTELDQQNYIEKLENEKNDIIDAYNKVVNENYVPIIDIKLQLTYGCYLVDCPIHQII